MSEENNSTEENDSTDEVDISDATTAEENNSTVAWVVMIASIIYCISPIDIIPDVPVLGWIDDSFIMTAAALNLAEKVCPESLLIIRQIAGWLKGCVILLGIIVILLVVFLGVFIFK